MSTAPPPFELVATLANGSHANAAVRAVSFCGDNATVATASLDQTGKLWRGPAAGRGEHTLIGTLDGHQMGGGTPAKASIYSVTFLPVSDGRPAGLVATASLDKTVLLWDPVMCGPVAKLEGHTDTVCCVRPAADGHVLTASWDGTAKLWSAASSKCVATITNPSTAKHELSFTAVLEHSQTKTILTASADRTIRRWSSDGTEVQVYAGHGGVIRGICWLSPTRFASCGAGGEIKVWDLDGSCLRTVNGHGGKMVYSIVGFEDGVGAGFATAGGDGCVWIWRDGECKQQLQLPCDAALMVDAAPNGDLVVACPDGTARVFSSEPDRQLPAPEIRTYKEMVTAALVKMEEAAAEGGGGSAGGMVGDLDTENLKGPEALEQPGKENGQ